jgi:uncharacterized protein with FMN-binding domain
MDEELKVLVRTAYNKILQGTNKMLRNCKIKNISVLQDENDPTYNEMADALVIASSIIKTVSQNYPNDVEGIHTAMKAEEYALSAQTLSKAIRIGDQELLKELIIELDKRSFL